MKPWVFVLSFLSALAALGLLMFWLISSFEGFGTYYNLVFFVGMGSVAYLEWRRREAKRNEASTEPARSQDPLPHTATKAPPTASAIPTEVLADWDAPLPSERSRSQDLDEDQPGGLFAEGFVPDRRFSPAKRNRSGRRL
jgi:hypothetical protein